MKRVLRILATVIVLALVVGVVVWRVGQAQQTAGAEVNPDAEILDSTTITRDDLTVTVSATGSVASEREVNLLFEVSGRVAEIRVEEGQHVSAGDILARLDVTELEQAIEDAQVALEFQRVAYDNLTAEPRDVDIAAAEAAVNAALAAQSAAAQGADVEQVEIARLQGELARNQLWQAQLQRDNTMEIGREFRGGDVGAPAQEIELEAGLTSAEYQIEISEANYNAAASEGPDQARVGTALAQLAQAQVALERLLDGPTALELEQSEIEMTRAELRIQQAQAALDKAALVAPFDGVIAQNNLTVGELPPAQGAAMLLLDDSAFHVDLAIDETDIIEVSNGQTVELRFDALEDDSITGTVSEVAIMPTGQGQLVTYDVQVVINDTDAPLRIGMTATATIIVSELDEVLTLPNRFIRIDRASGQAYATVQTDDGAFTEVPVEIGLRNETTSQVIAGLEEGQRIVLLPRQTFNPLGG